MGLVKTSLDNQQKRYQRFRRESGSALRSCKEKMAKSLPQDQDLKEQISARIWGTDKRERFGSVGSMRGLTLGSLLNATGGLENDGTYSFACLRAVHRSAIEDLELGGHLKAETGSGFLFVGGMKLCFQAFRIRPPSPSQSAPISCS